MFGKTSPSVTVCVCADTVVSVLRSLMIRVCQSVPFFHILAQLPWSVFCLNALRSLHPPALELMLLSLKHASAVAFHPNRNNGEKRWSGGCRCCCASTTTVWLTTRTWPSSSTCLESSRFVLMSLGRASSTLVLWHLCCVSCKIGFCRPLAYSAVVAQAPRS